MREHYAKKLMPTRLAGASYRNGQVAAGSTVCTQSSRHNTYRHYYITAEGRVQRGVGMQYLEQANRALSSSVRNTGGGWQMTATTGQPPAKWGVHGLAELATTVKTKPTVSTV